MITIIKTDILCAEIIQYEAVIVGWHSLTTTHQCDGLFSFSSIFNSLFVDLDINNVENKNFETFLINIKKLKNVTKL